MKQCLRLKLKHCLIIIGLFSFSLPFFAQTAIVSGTVIDSNDGGGIPGVSIIEKGTTNGVITDIDGKYTITLEQSPATISFSMVGMLTQEKEVRSGDIVNITLKTDEHLLEQVIVTGYTSQKKADLTGAVSVVNINETIAKSPQNILNSLEGRVSGVQINSDGTPGGGGTSIHIRGMTTLQAGNSPLYVIDGVPTMENINSINPGDIENIQVLKDASSASIYGARAASGVIIITTKKGKGNKLSVELDMSGGIQTVAKKFNMLNSAQWGQAYWQANLNDGMAPSHPFYGNGTQPVPTRYLDVAQLVPFSDTNWQNEVYSPSWVQSYSAVITNNTDRSSTMFSLNYTNQDGLMDHTYYNRISGRLNSTYKLSKYFNVGENLMVAKWNNLGADTQNDRGIPYTAMRQHPAIPVYGSNGNYANPMTLCSSDIANPAHQLYNARDNSNENWRILGNAYLEFLPIENLTLKSNFGIEHIQFFSNGLNRKIQESDRNGTNSAYGQGDTWTWTNTAVYNFRKDNHKMDLLAGTEAISYMYSGISAARMGYMFEDENYMVIDAGTEDPTNGGNKAAWSLFSVFGKADYNFADRYLLSGTIRRDASSRFGKNNNYGIFPAFSGAWRISEEDFMPKTDWLNYMKLRAGWGQTGNSEIGNYATYSSYGYDIGNAAYDLNGTGTNSIAGIKVMTTGNPDLKWETTTQTNIGLDAAILNHSLSISLDYYWKKTVDMLTIPPTLSVMGENAAKWMNTGDMKNNGFEMTLDYTGKKQGDFSWNGTLNIAKYKNELTRISDKVFQTGGNQRNMVGYPLGVFYGYVADGIFKTQDEVLNHANQTGKGLGRIRYRDLDHSGTIEDNGDNDQCVIGDPNPDLSLGLNLNFMYKNFTLSAFFNSDLGFDIYNITKHQLDFMTYGDVNSNRGTSVLEAWTPENPDASIPALTMMDNNRENRMSTYYIEDGSYVKLKNLRLNYLFAGNWLNKLQLSALNMYAQVDNVFTITKYSGLEPALPFGGIDNAPYPIARTFTLGLNMKF